MRKLIIVCLSLTFAAAAASQEPSATPTPSPSPTQVDSPMVRAAKASSSTAGTKNRIKITNDDVKKSKGKLSIVSSKPLEPAARDAAAQEVPTGMDKSEKEKARKTAQENYDAAVKRVESLTKALNAAEEAYYTADEPAVRDMVEHRFIQAKEDLDRARANVDAAREELKKTE